MKRFLICIVSIFFCTLPISSQAEEPELAPMPRKLPPPFQFKKITAGYQITIDRELTENLLDNLQKIKGEPAIGELIKITTKDLKEPESIALAEYMAQMIGKETPAFKEALKTKMGSDGVTIKVYGIEKGKDRPILRTIGKTLLPVDAQDKARALITIIRTRAVTWRVEPFTIESAKKTEH